MESTCYRTQTGDCRITLSKCSCRTKGILEGEILLYLNKKNIKLLMTFAPVDKSLGELRTGLDMEFQQAVRTAQDFVL